MFISIVLGYFIGFNKELKISNKLTPKNRRFRIEQFLKLKNCSFVKIKSYHSREILFTYHIPRNTSVFREILWVPSGSGGLKVFWRLEGILGVSEGSRRSRVSQWLPGVPGAPKVLGFQDWVLFFHYALFYFFYSMYSVLNSLLLFY